MKTLVIYNGCALQITKLIMDKAKAEISGE